ncbi:MAG TPA: proton-translocating transhydrogenase family protein [Caulifigura sp.]|jgi:hypothetical protein|nr:proton-translocating transhydrogenase family protein [Caulifigura sp.]
MQIMLADAGGFADPLVASGMIFLLTAVIGWRLFSDLGTADSSLRLAVPVALSGVALIGTIVAAAQSINWFGTILGLIASTLAGGAAVGGFLIVRGLVEGKRVIRPDSEKPATEAVTS